ncbi:MAG: 2-hydroxymuconic semialdehyde dehydrogenase [Myxococcales bacterium]|nr:2-hydroxymuconic semialdehyde dehydrogenase [Myxococcales bacterium]MCB9533239.1 2-hydroxymuconic semialdehyde dehydrogenase [Myxococcales bacterium]
MRTGRRVPLFIDGSPRAASSGRTFALRHPATGQVFGEVDEASAADVDAAVAAARRALAGPWGRMPTAERLRLLERVADGIEARFEEFAEAEIADTGKPASFARAVDIPRGAANFRIFASIARAAGTAAYQTDTPDGRGALNYVVRRPVGVVAVICPWNLPLLLMTWKVAPALAVGNAVVVKPSEETPQTAALLGEVMRDAGVPDGVYNVVHGFGPGSAGEALTRHPGVDAITFTGESRTGEAIMRAAASGVRPVSFELGGKNAALVFADCDLDAAVAGTVRSVFSNCGQVCLCSERVYVQRPIFETFVERLGQEARALRLGDPFDLDTGMGPLISAAHRDKVLSYFERARADGATVVAGGGVPPLPPELSGGFFVEPTVWTGLAETSRCVREEIFGPVCHVAPFDTEDEAVALANDSEYGLCAAVWTQELTRAHRVAAALDVGIVWVNSWFLRDLRTPFGGVKLSGLGREGGAHSLDFYSELKTVCVKL